MITWRNLLSFVLFIIALQVTSQEANFPKWGIFSDYEKNLTFYEKDTTAHAVVLNEIGYSKTENGGDYNIVTQVHIRIKILDTEGFEEGNIKIRYHKNEEITKVRATTTTMVNDTRMINDLDINDIYNEKLSDNYSSVNFTFPNLQKGSILEYSYIKKSPFYFNFGNGWTFQNDIPTLKSTFYALIPGFWHYNITTIGIENQLLDDEDQEMSNYTIENLNNFELPLIEKFEVISSEEKVNGNRWYFKPFQYYEFNKNPFKQKIRQYPVDFGYLRKYTYNIIFKIPVGYTVQESPKNRKIYLPEYAGELSYISETTAEKITIKLKLSLNKIVYESDEYENLKNLFAELIKIKNERIVLT